MRRDECTEQERWVLEQVEKGEVADLKKQFSKAEEKRCLRATFLEALLTDEIKDFKLERLGIQIAAAVITETINLFNAEIKHIVGLFRCVFQENVSFRDNIFKMHLSLNGSHFGKELDCPGYE
jgi:hypothetical protein